VALQPPVTVCVLCYGDYAALSHRLLDSLRQFTPPGAIRLRVGLNAVSEASRAAIEDLLPALQPELVICSETNLYKLPMMRHLLYDRPIETQWVVWFDDDSYVFRRDWLSMLSCESRLRPEVDMWGKQLFVRGDEHLWHFIREASWFQGLEPLPDEQPGKCRLNFIAGGYWAIRTGCLRGLNWPDPRLMHFGDDYLLGEALRQMGCRIGQATSGIAINCSARRAPSDTPRSEALR
jgi:hypothetical protein